MRIIKARETVEFTSYSRNFDYVGASRNHGFSFDCDRNGQVDMVALEKKPDALANYRKCLDGTHTVIDCGIREYHHHYNEPAIGACACGCEVVLDCFTNTCDGCNRDYNSSGQELANRSQWGEETGESLEEILNIRY